MRQGKKFGFGLRGETTTPTGTATKKGTPAEARVPSETQYVFLPWPGAHETASFQATPYEPK